MDVFTCIVCGDEACFYGPEDAEKAGWSRDRNMWGWVCDHPHCQKDAGAGSRIDPPGRAV